MASRLVKVFSTFEDLTDPRVARRQRHQLIAIIVVALCGTIVGDDVLLGWNGRDILLGGIGNDWFFVVTSGTNKDTQDRSGTEQVIGL